ncbi:MAG: methyltransferase type 11 [Sulfobacillus acidophilus]|uniref:Methyltransferase type 11 n=1 Tax=Sulfobacillus acidophilus TaxID=53633 RepID=A0A2T2WGT8_9FIRM|nr:MAG: methyltransferase type 11 [Sulfobacillus acidophilus]
MPDRRDPREFFGKYHEAYGTSPGHARGQDLDVLLTGLGVQQGESALDVATGGGHTALRLAEKGLQVTVADVTPAMLVDTVNRLNSGGFQVEAVEARAESLPWTDGTFDVVTCRRAAHHFDDVPGFLREAFRVLKDQGRIGISDMTASGEHILWLNHLEQLRDPSHHRALSPDEWYAQLVSIGFHRIELHLMEEPMSFAQWLAPVSVDSEDGARALSFLQEDAPWEIVRGQTFIKRRIVMWGCRMP